MTPTPQSEMVQAALLAVKLYASQHPVPSFLSHKQAAEVLGISGPTLKKMNPETTGDNRIPYSWVAVQMKASQTTTASYFDAPPGARRGGRRRALGQSPGATTVAR